MSFGLVDKIRKRVRRFLLGRSYSKFAHDGKKIIKVSYPERIGHLSQEIDGLLRDAVREDRDTKLLYLPDISSGFANRHLVSYYTQYINVVAALPAYEYVLDNGDPYGVLIETHPYEVAMYQTAKIYESFALWGIRPPLFKLKAEDLNAGLAALRDFDVPDGAWFVCLHVREGGYSPVDEHYHTYRNVDIETFAPAIEEIARHGGWILRMGDCTMRRHPPHPRVIDYAHHPAKSEQLDIAFPAMCRFFLGTASGLFNVAEMFGRPCVVTNMAPMSASLAPGIADISIFQRLRQKDGRVLTLKETLDSKCGNFRFAEEFEAAGFEHVKNTPEEIREVVIEMLQRLEGVPDYDNADRERQATFKSWFRNGHYAYGAKSSIGREFLRRHLTESVDCGEIH